MLTRRHIRVKVMQSIYALSLSEQGGLQESEAFLRRSIGQTFTLYLLILGIFRELQQFAEAQLALGANKYLKDGPRRPDASRLASNALFSVLASSERLAAELKKRKLKQWYLNEEYIKILYHQILESPEYEAYCQESPGWATDRDFALLVFREIIAPNDKIYDFLEDEGITWVDDLPLVNTFILKRLGKMREDAEEGFLFPALMKNTEDMAFALELLQKTLLNSEALAGEIEGKTPNWDKDRIAEIDRILLKMGIAELLYFPSIPERVTINEYLEIAKEYSTPKSSIFINGILDKLIREYKASGRLKKMGRGLL
ncbi:transcription antitermination factor NusB [Robiginitalea sp. M366]|uniref:transcription antitermination factor NusB n=1 Tax=Robiginitalea aestuariiviva TaxID=3036903 RepID=UPI00240E03C4|nr:transcription antitermination factor NusB [Robiginitalea aestuariiviva]MDG1572329.1 transcription antitermination factor NusB [Robiginitalea aestuariiviva]